jgi:hypothetical protein
MKEATMPSIIIVRTPADNGWNIVRVIIIPLPDEPA